MGVFYPIAVVNSEIFRKDASREVTGKPAIIRLDSSSSRSRQSNRTTLMHSARMIIISFITAFVMACNSSGNSGEFAKFDMINAATPIKNLMTGGQPSIADLKLLAAGGTKVVVNLRTKGEFNRYDEKSEVEKLGMKYVSIEIGGSDSINLETAKILDVALNNLEQPALVHCASSNRVGGLLAYRAFKIQGQPALEALSFGKSAGMSSTEKRVRNLLGVK